MVVNGLKSRAIAQYAGDQPFSTPIIDLALRMTLTDGLLDIAGIQSTRSYAHARVISPNETLYFHLASLSRGTDASSYAAASRERPEHGSISARVIG
jgi:hypothetical protein